MKKIFGLVFHMGLVVMPFYCVYWSRSHFYKNDMLSSVMSRERFQSIMRFLHLGNEPQQPHDRFSKVRFLINHLNNTMPEIYTPQKELSLDESMVLWRDWLMFRQFIKAKDINTGLNSLTYTWPMAFCWKSKSIVEQNLQILNNLGR